MSASPTSKSRRAFLVASASGVAGYRFGGPSLAKAAASQAPREGGGKDHLVPFVAGVVRRVDRGAKLVVIDPPEGLLEL